MDEALALHESAIVIDGLTFYYDGPTERLDPRRVTATNVTAAETSYHFARALSDIGGVREALRRDSATLLVRTAADIVLAKQDNKVGIILGLQASLPVDTDLSRVWDLYDLGVRIMQLTYNDRSYAGDGCLESTDGGLSHFGRRLIAEMASAGMVLDLSHVGRRTSLEALDACPRPLVISHANPVALTVNPRNLTDGLITAVARRGGVIGACSWPPLCWKNRPGVPPTVEDLLDHIDYLVNLAGIDHVGIATDSPCTTNRAWIEQHSREFSAAFPEITQDYNTQVRDQLAGQSLPPLPDVANLVLITEGLLRRGYPSEGIRKVLGENFLRVFKEVWR